MSFEWRYLVEDDGSFSRISNFNGCLDASSDEDLKKLHDRPDRRDRPLPPCSRCGMGLVLGWHGPLFSGVWMELCPVCDADGLAARALARWIRNPERDVRQLPQLFEDWETEVMQAKGWVRSLPESAPPGLPMYGGSAPRGRG
ncbi:DUF6300 family protein [Actinacidiphila oryziradicis]|uniref:Uncharacterized protein n=1 Tax=Actinacidiphila oryziradicis TaxID=2571141 RepID=A0A4U0SAL4_9ACTN|nr:DUF6300 family protein [Actinacidiphila oryziradicis]TKA06364.1 hypothetical protein FCI23_31750 [Actinacidiphila oryziradicis]